jgi:hypothetical protein
MKRLGTLLTGVALIVASGLFVSARADDDRESLTLFRPQYTEQASTATLSMSAANRC